MAYCTQQKKKCYWTENKCKEIAESETQSVSKNMSYPESARI